SRSRHTRSKRDWSSDVCSSDLRTLQVMGQKAKGHQELDRAIGEWKQQLLEEAEEIITGDFADMKVELAETTKRLEALGREAKKATAEAKVAERRFERIRSLITRVLFYTRAWLA